MCDLVFNVRWTLWSHHSIHTLPLLCIRTCIMEEHWLEQHTSCDLFGRTVMIFRSFNMADACSSVRSLVNWQNCHIFVYWANIMTMIKLSFDIAFLLVKLKLTYCVSCIFATFCTLFPIYGQSMCIVTYTGIWFSYDLIYSPVFILLCTQDCSKSCKIIWL